MRTATFPVLGNPRGGTSAVAGVLRILGVHMGDDVSDLTHEDLGLRGLSGDDLRDAIVERNSRHGRWGWKDPQLIDHVDDAVPVLREPRWIVVLRDPVQVAMSESAHVGRPLQVALQFAEERHRRLTMFAAAHPCSLTIEYRDVVGLPEVQVRRLAAWVDVNPRPDVVAAGVEFLSTGCYRTIDGQVHEGPLPIHP